MTGASALIRSGATESCLPCSRHALPAADWAQMAAALAEEPALALLALWADSAEVHALFFDEAHAEPLLASTRIEDGRYTALSAARPAAAWFERMVQDLWGHAADGGTDARPWLDHGRWPHARPMALRPDDRAGRGEPPEFLPLEDETLDQVPLGPVHGGIEPASHLRLTVRGETIVRLEVRLGYTHKGTLALMRGKSPRAAARFAARLSGAATVAHAIAFAQATEAALQAEPPPRAIGLRGVMAEIERITAHLGSLGAIGETAGSPVLAARCGSHQEAVHRVAGIAFGHRLMMDCVVPGGIAADIAPGGPEAVLQALITLAAGLPELDELCGRGPPSRRLHGIATVSTAQAQSVAAGGVIGRAAGRASDVRRAPGYRPYALLAPPVPAPAAGDAAARTRQRLMEIGESIGLLRALLEALPPGPVSIPLPAASGEGVGFAEAAHGDIWHWLRLDHGQIAAVFMRDPAWAHWPLLEMIAPGAQMADLPLIQASFDLAASGVDL
jgi:Ni,Fe-hydrogenase III large subunit